MKRLNILENLFDVDNYEYDKPDIETLVEWYFCSIRNM